MDTIKEDIEKPLDFIYTQRSFNELFTNAYPACLNSYYDEPLQLTFIPLTLLILKTTEQISE